MGEEASRRNRGGGHAEGATGAPGTGAGPASRGAVGSEHRVLKSTFITLAGAAFLAGGARNLHKQGGARQRAGGHAATRAAGFALGMRREMRKFRELAEQQAKGGKYVPPPNFELGARAFVYGSILCWTGGAVAWAAVQYAFGVTNVRPACAPARSKSISPGAWGPLLCGILQKAASLARTRA